jgi:hypothetical protein
MARVPIVGPKSRPGDKARREQLATLYAELPTIDCAGKCAESCGPIMMGRVEWQNMCRAGGERYAGNDLTCPYLEQERCTVYAARPLICRLWGIVETMPCLWGCVPSRYLTHEEGHKFIARAREINE